MKSHDIADSLSTLARMLKAGPNVELAQLDIKDAFSGPHSGQNLALNLTTLVSLSSVDKSKWVELIREHGFPIDIRPRDGSRDVLGKLFAYLEENPLAQEKLKASATRSTSKSSPELMKALSTLLKDTRNEPHPEGN
jgi:biotin operon repressor